MMRPSPRLFPRPPFRLLAWLPALVLPTLLALAQGEDAPAEPPKPPTAEEIAALTYDDVAYDTDFVSPFAHDFDSLKDSEERRKDWDDFTAKLDTWAPGKVADLTERVRNLISVAGLMDMGQGQFESETPLLVYQRLSHEISKEELKKILAMMVFHPEVGKIVETAPELDLNIGVGDEQVRERVTLYAKKMLGRLMGKLPVDPNR